MPLQPIKGEHVVLGEDVQMSDTCAIWNFIYIGSRTKIGHRVTIGSHVHIGSEVEIGDDTLIEGAAYIPDGCSIGKRCFLGPNVTLTNDQFPPIRRSTGVAAWSAPKIDDDVIVGAGACLKAGIRIGSGAVIGMGAVVLADVEAGTVVVGTPARRIYSRDEYDRRQRKRASDWERRDEEP